MSYTEHKICRACGSTKLTPVFDMGEHPLANDHCLPLEERQGFYPLKVLLCEKCSLAQLSVVVDREQIYRRYSYVSSSSQTMKRHYDRLFIDIGSEQPSRKIVEIASNDGGCLEFAQCKGYEVFGIDPARNLAAIAESHGIPTHPEFFGMDAAGAVLSKFGQPGVILARHVLAHVDDWRDFFKALNLISDQNTLVVFEFPYAMDLLRKLSWDTIYHEHLSIINLKALVEALRHTGFHIHRIIKVGVHGGALVVMLRHNASSVTPHLSADEMLSEENITIDDWKAFSLSSENKISNIRDVVTGLAGKGKIVSVFGASAKSTVMIRACRLSKAETPFCTDNSPFKPGRLIPGSDIPIIEESEMLSHHPDYALLGSWNYLDEVISKTEKWRARGGRFLVPDRELRIV